LVNLLYKFKILGFFKAVKTVELVINCATFLEQKREICAKQMLFEIIVFSILADASTTHKTPPHTHKHLKGTMPQQ